MHRLLALAAALPLLPACSYHWRTVEGFDECAAFIWYQDADGDGWGDPNIPGIFTPGEPLDCGPNTELGFTATNNRDCDDADAAITGRAGGLCPDGVLNGNGTVEQFAYNVNEYLFTSVPLVDGDNDGKITVGLPDDTDGSGVAWPAYGAEVCGSAGWGGTYVVVETDADGNTVFLEDQVDGTIPPAGLVTIQEDGELNEIRNRADAYEFWVGWIGAVPTSDLSGWEWENGATGLDLGGGDLPFCDGLAEVPADEALHRLALIKRRLRTPDDDRQSEWCVGNPDVVFGRYFKDVETLSDRDADGLRDQEEDELFCGDDVPVTSSTAPSADGQDPGDYDSDDDGIGDGQECEVLGTDPDGPDSFPVLTPGDADPQPAFQTELAYFVCERIAPDPDRFAMGIREDVGTEEPAE